jgi:hypothetical protein
MVDLILYGASSAFVVLFSYWMHHAYVTTKMLQQMRAEEQESVRRLDELIANARGLPAPSTMCKGCSVGTAKPPSRYCDECREMLPKLGRMGGDFICHQSVYDENMDLRDKSEHRQCPGATKFHKDGG